jgi:ComF family protein
MDPLSILKDIFLEEVPVLSSPTSPKNLTDHYRQELRNSYFDEVCVGANYSDLESKIERYKYHSDRHLSTEFVEVMSKCVEASRLYGEYHDWVVIPVPMHWSRYVLRGFHHTRTLAKCLAKKLSLSLEYPISTRYRPRQSQLLRTKRIENKKNSFFIKSGYTVPSHVILIDDVISSGATLDEAAKTLKNA